MAATPEAGRRLDPDRFLPKRLHQLRGHQAPEAKAPPPPPPEPVVPRMYPGRGIMPVPMNTPPGAVSAIGALPAFAPQMMGNRERKFASAIRPA